MKNNFLLFVFLFLVKISFAQEQPPSTAPVKQNNLRISVLGIFTQPHLSYEHVTQKGFSVTLTAAYKLPAAFLAGTGFFLNPDLLLKGPCGYVDFGYVKPADKNISFCFGVRGGYRDLSLLNTWVGYLGRDDQLHWKINRYRQDYLVQVRAGYEILSGHFFFGSYLGVGARAAKYHTEFLETNAPWINGNPPPKDYQFNYHENGTYGHLEFHLNADIGFAW